MKSGRYHRNEYPRFKNWRAAKVRCLTVLLVCLPGLVHASDCRNDGASDKSTPNTLLTLPSITVSSDAPIGTTLWSQTGIPFSVYCSSGAFSWASTILLWRQDLTLPAYGLELVLTYKGNRGSNNEKISTGIEGNNNDVSGTIDLLLRKSSATPSSGVVAVATKTLFYLTGSISSQTDAPQQIAGLNNIVFTTSTCDVDTGSRSITVQLGDIRRDYFSGIGSTSTDRNFVINLNCSQPSGIYNVTLKLNATRDNTGAPGVMALDERGDKATGVGIQLLMNGTPVEFGTFASVGSATTDTTLSVPMTARYYQTANPVTPGVANAVATFLVNYK